MLVVAQGVKVISLPLLVLGLYKPRAVLAAFEEALLLLELRLELQQVLVLVVVVLAAVVEKALDVIHATVTAAVAVLAGINHALELLVAVKVHHHSPQVQMALTAVAVAVAVMATVA